MEETIFIAMAAQDDEEIKHSVRYAFENAKNSKRVCVGIALTSIKRKTLKEVKQLTKKYNVRLSFVKQKRNNLSMLGIGKGRLRAANLYKNENYMIQVDCHTFFDKDWDSKLISLFKEAKKYSKKEKIVLTAIPPAYRYCCSEHKDPIKTDPNNRYAYYETQSFFVNVIPKWKETDISKKTNVKFIPCAKANPAFIMGKQDFAKNPGIHEKATFYDEDLTQSINLFGKGFAFVFPNVEDLPIRHLDSNGIIEGHTRFFLLNYLNAENQDLLHENMQKEYIAFAKDPKNAKIINEYKKYSKVDALRGCFTNNKEIIPKTFR